MNYQGSTCVCRVPKAQLRPGTVVECVHCGMSSRTKEGNHVTDDTRQAVAVVVLILDAVSRSRYLCVYILCHLIVPIQFLVECK